MDLVSAAEMVAILDRLGGLSATKAVMRMIGLDCGASRLPQRNLSRDQYDRLCVELEDMGFFEECLRP